MTELMIMALIVMFNVNAIINDVKERKVRHIVKMLGLASALFASVYMPLHFDLFLVVLLVTVAMFHFGNALGGGDTAFAINALFSWHAGPILFLSVLFLAVMSYLLHNKDYNKYKGYPIHAVASMVLLVVMLSTKLTGSSFF